MVERLLHRAVLPWTETAITPIQSPAVEVAPGNAVQLTCVLVNASASSTTTVQLQESNDLENWSDVSGAVVELSGPVAYATLLGPEVAAGERLGSRYYRVRAQAAGLVGGSGVAILAVYAKTIQA